MPREPPVTRATRSREADIRRPPGFFCEWRPLSTVKAEQVLDLAVGCVVAHLRPGDHARIGGIFRIRELRAARALDHEVLNVTLRAVFRHADGRGAQMVV